MTADHLPDQNSSRYDVGIGIFGGLTPTDFGEAPERMWSVRMGDVRVVVYADHYEGAVREFEAWCLENDIERKGAEFLRGRLHDVSDTSDENGETQ